MKWTQAEIETLRTYYPHHGGSWPEWKKLLPRHTPAAIANKACVIGCKCDPAVYKNNAAQGRRKSLYVSKLGRRWTKAEDKFLATLLLDAIKETGRSGEAVVARMQELMYQHRRKKL